MKYWKHSVCPLKEHQFAWNNTNSQQSQVRLHACIDYNHISCTLSTYMYSVEGLSCASRCEPLNWSIDEFKWPPNLSQSQQRGQQSIFSTHLCTLLSVMHLTIYRYCAVINILSRDWLGVNSNLVALSATNELVSIATAKRKRAR